MGLAAEGRATEAEQTYEEVLTKVGPGAQSQRVQMGKGWLDLAQDDHMTARRELHGAVPTEYRMGSTRISLWAQAWLARADFALGAWDEAVRTVHRAAAQVERSGLDLVRPLVHWTGAQVQALRGNWDAVHEHLQQASATTHDYEVMLLPACLGSWASSMIEPFPMPFLRGNVLIQCRAGAVSNRPRGRALSGSRQAS